MENGKFSEKKSLEIFGKIVPRNPNDWFGSVALYSTLCRSFFNIAFGQGDNLSHEDMDEGCDDYIMVDQFHPKASFLIGDVFLAAKRNGYIDSYTCSVLEADGGQWLLRRKEWTDGDIRRFIVDALDFAGYGVPEKFKDMMYKDLIFIGADYNYNKENEDED